MNTVHQSNLLASNPTARDYTANFTPTLTSHVRAVTAFPDGPRMFNGKAFTTVPRQNYSHIAAWDIATETPVSNVWLRIRVATFTRRARSTPSPCCLGHRSKLTPLSPGTSFRADTAQ